MSDKPIDIVERLRDCLSQEAGYCLLEEAAAEITALRERSASSAAEVEVLRREVETLRNRDVVLNYIRDHCKVVAWPGRGAYPIEHNPQAGKDSWKDIALLAYAAALLATDASGAMNTQPGGSDE